MQQRIHLLSKVICIVSLACQPLVLSMPLAADTQKIDLRFQYIGTENGLSSNAIMSISQDRLGFFWIATELDGLNRYDGYSFVHYRHSFNKAETISSNHILCVYNPSRSHLLWIATKDGIDIFDPHTEKVLHFFEMSQFGSPVSAMAEGRSGEILLGTYNGELIRVDGGSSRILSRLDPFKSSGLQRKKITSILESEDGDIWINSTSGLFRLSPSSGRLIRPEIDGGKPTEEDFQIQSCRDQQGNLWFASNSGLHCFNRSDSSFRHFPLPEGTGIDRRSSAQFFMLADRTGWIWIATERELRLFDRSTEKYVEFNPCRKVLGDPTEKNLTTPIEDPAGNVWIGAWPVGLFKFNRHFNQFRHFGYDHDPRCGLIDPKIYSILEDRNGIVWMGTLNGILTRYDPASGEFRHYEGVPFNTSDSPPKIIQALFEDSSGTLWVGTTAGLVIFDRLSGRFRNFSLRPERPGPTSIAPKRIVAILEERPGKLVVNSFREGIFYVDTIRHTFTMTPIQELIPDGSYWRMGRLFLDRAGTLWVSSCKGLHRLDLKSRRFSHFLVDESKQGHLPQGVYQMIEDLNGNLWMDSHYGICRMDRMHGKFKTYPEPGKPGGNLALGLIDDNDGYIWYNNGSGLTRFDPRLESFRFFKPVDGVSMGEGFASCRSRDGKLLFGGDKGLVIFDPREVVKANTHVPPVFFIALHVGDREVPLHQVFSQRDQTKENGRVTLRPGDRVLAVEFAALDFSAPEKNRYAFRMEEQGEKWNDLGTRRQLTFSNLSVGSHTLRVKGSNNDGVWNETGVALQIVVLPHFWQTWWFKVLALLILAGIVLAIVAVCRTISSLRKIAKPPNLDEIFNKYKISHREQEILHLVIQGKSNREMENKLFISIPTVKRHLANIYEKIGVSSRLQLINFLQGRKPRY